MVDEVLEELWRVKDEIARENDYDVRRLADSLKKTEQDWHRRKAELDSHLAEDAAGAAVRGSAKQQ